MRLLVQSPLVLFLTC